MNTTKHPIAATYAGAHGQPITRAAFIALRAAALRDSIGAYAARQYYLAHSGAHSLRLYRIACQLQALTQQTAYSSLDAAVQRYTQRTQRNALDFTQQQS